MASDICHELYAVFLKGNFLKYYLCLRWFLRKDRDILEFLEFVDEFEGVGFFSKSKGFCSLAILFPKIFRKLGKYPRTRIFWICWLVRGCRFGRGRLPCNSILLRRGRRGFVFLAYLLRLILCILRRGVRLAFRMKNNE